MARFQIPDSRFKIPDSGPSTKQLLASADCHCSGFPLADLFQFLEECLAFAALFFRAALPASANALQLPQEFVSATARFVRPPRFLCNVALTLQVGVLQ